MERINTLIDNRYLIQKILGRGNSSGTYLALDTHRFQEACLLKEFTPWEREPPQLEEFRHLFQQEAKVLHQLSHPHISRLLACFEGQGRLFLVQEYIKGQSYSALLRERQQSQQVFSELEIVKFLQSLLPILDYIHRLGIIHGDISPNNIIQSSEKNLPILVDFGVKKLINKQQTAYYNVPQQQPYTETISFIGKLGYAPREQMMFNCYFPYTDIYALGVTALVLLTGKSPTALWDKISLEWQWQKYVSISRDLVAILSRMTADKPLERYQSARQVLQDLAKCDVDSLAADTIIPTSRKNNSDRGSLTTNPTSSNSSPYPKGKIDDETIILNPNMTSPPQDETVIINRGDYSSSEENKSLVDKTTVNSKNSQALFSDRTIIISPPNEPNNSK